MDKRGLQHVEAILSFVLFFGFLIFVLYFLNPLGGQTTGDGIVVSIADGVLENITTDLETYSVSVREIQVPVGSTGGAGGSVGEVGGGFGIGETPAQVNVIRVGVMPVSSGVGVRVEDSGGERLSSSFLGSLVVNREGRNFFVVKLSDGIRQEHDNLANPLTLDDGQYVVASSELRRVASEMKFRELVMNYEEDYDILKEELKVPEGADFSVEMILDGERISGGRNVPEGVEVYSLSERVEVIREDGSTAFADLMVRIW